MFAHKKQWGSIEGAPFGIPAYSNIHFKWDHSKANEYQHFLSKKESKLARDVYLGFKYQCVEYARRFLVYFTQCSFTDVHCAYQIWDLVTVEDLTQAIGKFQFVGYRQGGRIKPEIGDLIIYQQSSKQKYGHVAVVVDVGDNYVDIAEQNYEDRGWECNNYARRLQMQCKDGCYIVTNIRYNNPHQVHYWWDKAETIIGWKRIIKQNNKL